MLARAEARGAHYGLRPLFFSSAGLASASAFGSDARASGDAAAAGDFAAAEALAASAFAASALALGSPDSSRALAYAGSDGLRQWRLGLAAPLGGGLSLVAQLSKFRIDGSRAHSAAERSLGNARLAWDGERHRVIVALNSLNQPSLRGRSAAGIRPS